MLLHQGESDAYSDQWLQKVKKVYTELLGDLGLTAADVPLIAGEVVTQAMGGQCGGANTTINRLPSVISSAHVVSAAGLAHQGDALHFSSASYRELGRRYAAKALELLGVQQDDGDSPKQTTKVHADFSNPSLSSEVQWDAATHTMTWTQKWANQIRNLQLPSGDLTGYEKIGVESADLRGQNFRLLVYNGSDATTITVTQTGVQEFRLADYVSASNLKSVTEVVLSGGNGEENGSVRILDLWLETFDQSAPAKQSPELSFTPSVVTLTEGDAFTAPVLSNPHSLPVVYTVAADPEGFATIDAATGQLTLSEGRGRATVTATFSGNDDYEAGEASYLIIVRAKTTGDERPLVYDEEFTGADFPAPACPDRKDLPFIEQLTDPLLYSDGSGRALDFSDWNRRRSEIAHELWHYELGHKPAVTADQVEASMNGNRLTVKVTVSNKSITLTSTISYPSGGQGPYPLMIGINGNGGSLPSAVFDVGGIAHMAYTVSQVATDSQNGGNGSGPFDTLYPELSNIGCESKWAWGVSRLIDGLQQLGSEVSRIDTEHIGITGCSWAGKCTLYCGAFDERIALTIPQEPGGGGVAAWRVTNWSPLNMEGINNTNYTWFLPSLRDNFSGDNVSYLPFDQHELAAMICPRAVLVLGNPSIDWLADPSAYVSMSAARKVWEQYGIEDRCGFSLVGGHDHCNLPSSQYNDVRAFLRRFLLGQDDVDTNITIAPAAYADSYDVSRWTQWWGTDQQPPIYLPTGDEGEHSFYMEAEQMITPANGQNFTIGSSDACSGGRYVETKVNATTLSQDRANWLIADFEVEEEGIYYVYARLNCNGSYDDDSYYVGYDSDDPARANGLAASGNAWTWLNMGSYIDDGKLNVHLASGSHRLIIVGREDGAKIDCIKISTSRMVPDANVMVPKETGINTAQHAAVSAAGKGAHDLLGRPVGQVVKGVYIVKGKKHLSQ